MKWSSRYGQHADGSFTSIRKLSVKGITVTGVLSVLRPPVFQLEDKGFVTILRTII